MCGSMPPPPPSLPPKKSFIYLLSNLVSNLRGHQIFIWQKNMKLAQKFLNIGMTGHQSSEHANCFALDRRL